MLTAAKLSANEGEVPEVSKDWYRWCRLCANDDVQNINIFLKDEYSTTTAEYTTEEQLEWKLADAIEKYFCLEITKEEQELPKQLCTQCFALMTSMIDYGKRVAKVQQMYHELQKAQQGTTEHEIQSLRLEFGILKNYRVINMVKNSLENAQQLFKEQIKDAKGKHLNVEIDDKMEILQPPHRALSEYEIKVENNFTDITTLTANENVCDFENEDIAVDEEDPFASDNEEINNEINVELNEISKEGEVKPEKAAEIAQTDAAAAQQQQQPVGEEPSKKTIKVYKKKRAPENKEYKYVCNECPLKFRRIGSYRLHLHRKHDVPLPTLTCDQCSKIFKTEYELKKHIFTHRPESEKNIFPCPQCERKFQNKDYVTKHIQYVHENVRPFVCEECGETVRTEAALREHMLVHSDYAAFECEICKKRFKNRARLKKHLETHSSNKYTCEECGLQLNSRATLNLHRLVHSDEMPHKCDYCGRAFKRAKTLKSHLILHSGLKPYSCNFCDKTFSNGPNCRTHKLKSHPEELAALEAAGGKAYTKNIPKLSVLKTVTRTVENLTPVICKNNSRKRITDTNSESFNVVTALTVPPTCF